MRIVTTYPLLSPSFSINQLHFWEMFQPIQMNVVLQGMWLHRRKIKDSRSGFGCQSCVPSQCLKHLSSPCMGHYFWTHPWCLYPLLSFKTCISQNCRGRLIFVAADLFTYLSYHTMVKYCSCSLILLCADTFCLNLDDNLNRTPNKWQFFESHKHVYSATANKE